MANMLADAAAENYPAYQLIATDLDGTLLDSDGSVPERSRAVLRRLAAAGVVVSFATSRRWTGARTVAETLGLQMPLILYDGAQTRMYPSGEILASEPLESATAQAAAEIIVAHGLRPIVQFGYERGEYLRTVPYQSAIDCSAPYLDLFGAQLRIVPLAELTVAGALPLRLVAFGAYRRLRRLAGELAHLPCGRQLLRAGNYSWAELTLFSTRASKGQALARLADHLRIPLAATFAIGDGVNDVSLLEMAEMSVAMAHAPTVVRKAAKALAETPGALGVASALERYVLPGALAAEDAEDESGAYGSAIS